MTEFVFVHGWGQRPTFWNPLIARLGEEKIHLIDLGYFGQPQTDLPENAYIFVTHSYGGLWALKNMTPACQGVFFINGFTKFCADESWPFGVPAKVLSRMVRKFPIDSEKVWSDFMALCGLPESSCPEGMNSQRLEKDLKALGEIDARELYAGLDIPVGALACSNDPVVPCALTRASFGDVVQEISAVNHLAPLMYVVETEYAFKAFLRQIQ